MNEFLVKIKNNIITIFLFKLISLFLSLLIIVGLSFLIRNFVLQSNELEKDLIGNFLGFKISFNSGVSFSSFSNNVTLTYFLQSLFILITFICIFIIKDKTLIIFMCLVFSGGVSNLIDRAVVDELSLNSSIHYNTVVDYLYFPFIKNSAIFNFQDIIIVLSWIGFVIRLIIYKIKTVEKKDEKNNI